MKVLVNGAGIAGNALAFWLSRIGHSVTVLERYPELRVTGLQIDLRGHGIEVLKRMGLKEEFHRYMPPETGIQIVNSSGKRIAYFPANKSGKGLQDFTTEYEIMRGDFCKVLYDATKDRATYVFDTSITSFVDNGKMVEVQFSDGRTDDFDLVVGADGIGSRTRKIMGLDGFHSCDGQYTAYFTLPWQIRTDEDYIATMYMATGGRGVMTRRNNARELQSYLFCKTSSESLLQAQRGSEQERAALVDIMRGSGWQTEEILNALPKVKDFYCERLGLVKLESWSRGRVALVGDAAYCPSANTGMGTTCALVGAYVLAGEISEHKQDVSAAFRAYDRKFKPFVDQVQAGVLEKGAGLPSSWLGIAFINGMLSVASFFKVNVFGRFFLKENVKGWELPLYENMVGN
ncbi:uncharacterized protein HMPREF1541_00053 [Cyphellophora europaea CBS 101466]|uniref:FAD-binding domain-containing protein n=1 Tax=Cyphellophora europaea (strain CBS 101466) TaxID=1220924 RepID=W2SB10_CYPE1|nr:uncharacterized protein HMPREF1541_00053 [Cyphellophora europaea CBS 101466]ETN45872.1 hypothetical protein HMPREF1541_00053 [Cyphellophora europaea CBS 101466]